MAGDQNASEVLTIAAEAIGEPVPGSPPAQRGEGLPNGPFARMPRLPAEGEAAVSGFEPVRCSACSGIIGVYEPLIVRLRGEDRASSLAAEPALPLAGAQHLHLACAQGRPLSA